MKGSGCFGKTKMANKVVPQKNDLSLYKDRFFYDIGNSFSIS